MTSNNLSRIFLSVLVLFLSGVFAPTAKAACYQSRITAPSPFMGNNDEVFVLTDGSVWQVKYEYEYLYEYSPTVIICPAQNKLIIGDKSLNVASIRPSGSSGGSTSQATRNALTVIYRVSGCDYFIANGPAGLYVVEWYRGYDPSEGDKFVGYERGYGFKNIVYLRNGREGRIYIQDYLLSAERAAEILADKC